MIIARPAAPGSYESHPVAASPRPAVSVVEDHDEAYYVWKAAGVQHRVLLHFDAHIDFAWIAPSPEILLKQTRLSDVFSALHQTPFWTLSGKTEEERTHLGNYIHQAIRADLVQEFIWVYPEDQDRAKQASAVRSILESLAATAPQLFQLFNPADTGCFEGRIYGKRFRAFPYSAFSTQAFEEVVLLDIDLDFFIVRSLYSRHYPHADVQTPSFWLSPAEFVARLHASGLRYELVTLAYSVEEGYTPLRLKFLGTELAARLARSLSDEEERGFRILRDLFGADAPPHPASAVQTLEEELSRNPGSAALQFNLAMLLLEVNDISRAAAHYACAIEADPSYRTRYNHAGPVLLDQGLTREASASYERMKRLDPAHTYYRLFDLESLAASGNWAQALALGRELSRNGVDDPTLPLTLAECYLHLHRYEDAWRELGLYRPSATGGLRHDIRHAWVKARVAEALHRLEEAVACYHALIRHGVRAPGLHWSLTRLYVHKRNFYKARRHLLKAAFLALLPGISALVRRRRTWGSKT
jgi:tetratricopeptide (TPR) repeat protein